MRGKEKNKVEVKLLMDTREIGKTLIILGS